MAKELYEKRSTILIVDDNTTFHNLLKVTLLNDGYTVREASTHASFLKHLKATEFDLILSEISIQGYDTLDAVCSLKHKRPNLKFIIFTDKGNEEIAVKAIRSGAYDYIVKNTSHLDKLLVSINNALDGSDLNLNLKTRDIALFEGEIKYRRLLGSMMDGYAFVNMDGTIVECNQAFQQMVKYSFKELLLLKFSDITPTKWHDLEANIINEQVIPRGYSEIYVKEYLKKDGTTIPVEIRTFLYRNENGVDAGMWAVVRDITQRKQFEEILMNSEENFRELFEYSPIGKSIITLDGSLYANKTFCDILGYTKSELSSLIWDDIVCKEDIALSNKLKQTLLSGQNKVVRYETRFRHKTGHIIFGEVLTHLRRDIDNKPKFFITTVTDISDRKMAEEKLKISESRFRSYFDLSIAGFAITSPDMKWIEVNSFLCDMLGYSKEELAKLTWKELTHPDDIDLDLIKFHRLMEGEIEGYTMDKRFLHREGKTIWTSMSVKCSRNIDGSVNYILAILVDISARIKTNEELLRKTSELELILQNMHNAFIIWESVFDEKGNYVSFRFSYFNDAFSKYAKLKLEDVKGKDIYEVWPETEQSWLDVYKTVATTGNPKTFDMYHSPTKGWYHCSAYRPTDSKMICVIVENITVSKQLEDKLAWEQYLMESLLDTIPDYIYFKDLESRFIRINKALGKVFGLKDTLAAIGKSDVDFFKSTQSLEAYHDEQNIIKTGIPLIGKEERQVWADYPILWVSTTKMPLRDTNGNIIGTFGVSRDITEIKNFQDDLILAKEKAEESDILKTAFLQNISHEIRTPLNAISGFASLLDKPDLSQDKKLEFIRIINISCDQLISVITGIISLSTLETGQEKNIESKTILNVLLSDIYVQFSINHSRKEVNLIYETDISDELSTVYIDSVKLIQVLINLVGNALKFTSQGFVKFGFQIKENKIEFFVVDSGIGIPKEMHNQVFERFRQLDNSSTRRYGGSGIGLALSKGYVELMGGTIKLISSPGAGSIFSFELPYKPVYVMSDSPILLQNQSINKNSYN